MTSTNRTDTRETGLDAETAPDFSSHDDQPAVKARDLPAAALRALAEAEERRKHTQLAAEQSERELGGRGGADPARYGDWEINGRAIDF